jgi:hypothetical protein
MISFPRHEGSLHLTHNDHKSSYQTVAEDLADYLAIHGRPVDFVSEEERAKAIATNEMWDLHWYPDHPVSFHSVRASSLEAIWEWLRAEKFLPEPSPPAANTGSVARSERVKRLFLNRVRSLFNIDGFLLPELDRAEQHTFTRDPVRYLMGAEDGKAAAIWREVEKRQDDQVTEAFMDRSAKAAISALMSLEATAKMLEKWAPEIFPEVNDKGQMHFGRIMMEGAAESIREAFANAIKQVETPRTPPSVAAATAIAEAAGGGT